MITMASVITTRQNVFTVKALSATTCILLAADGTTEYGYKLTDIAALMEAGKMTISEPEQEAITMSSLVEDAISDFNDEDSAFQGTYGFSDKETTHGEVQLRIEVISGVTSTKADHFRKNWKLNGKVISAKKLEALIGA